MAAKNYTEILALVNAGNQMGLSNTIKRDYGIPLDFTSVQPSFDEAVKYAAENTKAYVGQPLSVGGKLYIINDVAAETKYVIGDKEYDNYLVEVGSATEGDGVTIDLEEGVLTLHGFESALTGYLPRKAEDGTLEWVPISAVVHGDGNKVTTLTSTDGSVEITKTTDTDESLVYDLKVVHPTAPEYAITADERAEGATETTYRLTKDGENVDVAIVVPDAYNDTALTARVKALEDEERYDDTELANRVSEAETKIGELEEAVANIDFIDADELGAALVPYATTEYVDEELAKKAKQTDLEALEDKVDAFLSGTGATDALDSLQELIDYINTHDDADINGILASIQAIENKLVGVDTTVADYVTAAINALQIGDYAKAADLTALAGRVATLEAKPFDSYATKTEVNDVDAKFADYYTKTEVDNKGYAVATEVADTYATKQSLTDLNNTFSATLGDYAKITDVNAELAKKIESGSIAHTSEGVAEGVTVNGTALNIVVDSYTKKEVRDYVSEVIETMTGGESAAEVKIALESHIDTYEAKVGEIDAKDKAQDEAIATADAKGAQGIADAAAAKSVADEAKAQAETNKTDIAGQLTRIGVLETAKGDHETRISTAEGQIAALLAEDQAINTTLGTLSGNIVALQGEDSKLAGLISANTEAIGKKANATDVYTKGEVDTKVQEAIDAIPEVDFTPYLKIADAASTYATITALEGVSGALTAEIERAQAAEKKIADDLALLIENPTEALDSVKELIEHVQANGTAVAGIITRLDGHDTSINDLVTRVTTLEAKPDYELSAATKETLGGVKLSNEINTNDDGQLEVTALSTDKLVNGTQEFVLNGGNAKGAATVA